MRINITGNILLGLFFLFNKHDDYVIFQSMLQWADRRQLSKFQK